MIELFSDPLVCSTFALRGGTALHRLYFSPPGRYSEDIDLVQLKPERIGPALAAMRAQLDPWLGEPEWKTGKESVKLNYRFQSEASPVARLRLKIEINICEHKACETPIFENFSTQNGWFSGEAKITTFTLEELLATKLRALYQRRKSRDLFDLWLAPHLVPELRVRAVTDGFARYISHQKLVVSRSEFERNLYEKQRDSLFTEDILALLNDIYRKEFNINNALTFVLEKYISQVPGEPWKGKEKRRLRL
ncbi:MAG: nucleotidyl transferase AbiEii/AbiGii toxin family protein [Planctomycetota bacterium]